MSASAPHAALGFLAEPVTFWTWWLEHEARIHATPLADPDGIYAWVARAGGALDKVHPDLRLEVGPPLTDGRRDLVVSAGGVRTAFPAVQALVACAPELPRWRLIAFKPRRPVTGFVLRVRDVDLALEDIGVEATRVGHQLDIVLHIPGYRPTPEQVFEEAAMIALDFAVGEFDVETRIAGIGFKARSGLKKPGLRPLADLPRLLDALPPIH